MSVWTSNQVIFSVFLCLIGVLGFIVPIIKPYPNMKRSEALWRTYHGLYSVTLACSSVAAFVVAAAPYLEIAILVLLVADFALLFIADHLDRQYLIRHEPLARKILHVDLKDNIAKFKEVCMRLCLTYENLELETEGDDWKSVLENCINNVSLGDIILLSKKVWKDHLISQDLLLENGKVVTTDQKQVPLVEYEDLIKDNTSEISKRALIQKLVADCIFENIN